MRNIYDIFDDIEEQKGEFLQSTFLSPVLSDNIIFIRISGLVYKFRVADITKGWKILSPQSEKCAEIKRDASFTEVSNYFNIFKRVYFRALFSKEGVLYCFPRGNADMRFGAIDITPVFLADTDLINRFDIITARFDGVNYWFEDIDFSANPMQAQSMCNLLDDLTEPDCLRIVGLTPFDKEAYTIMHRIKMANEVDVNQVYLNRMIEGAGGELVQYSESGSQFSVEYKIDGTLQPPAIVRKDDFNVISSGVCLTNEGDFDLTSLVSVMQERQSLGGNPNNYAWHREWGDEGRDDYNETEHHNNTEGYQ